MEQFCQLELGLLQKWDMGNYGCSLGAEWFRQKPNLNKLKTTRTPNKNGSHGIKKGGFVCHIFGSVCHIFCRNPLILADFHAIRTPIVGAYLLQIWGGGEKVRFVNFRGRSPELVSEPTCRLEMLYNTP